jgi:hypothetical protein
MPSYTQLFQYDHHGAVKTAVKSAGSTAKFRVANYISVLEKLNLASCNIQNSYFGQEQYFRPRRRFEIHEG